MGEGPFDKDRALRSLGLFEPIILLGSMIWRLFLRPCAWLDYRDVLYCDDVYRPVLNWVTPAPYPPLLLTMGRLLLPLPVIL